MRKSRILFGSIALAFLLSACGGSSSDAAMGKSYEPEAEEYYYDSYDTTEESKMAADESYEEANVDLG
ncbi:MAG: hypothetical protein K5931_07365, partial [Lachnospiraceae bacterium]|nr:hypothetical protein [Lachnospiraceae bacterium]